MEEGERGRRVEETEMETERKRETQLQTRDTSTCDTYGGLSGN